MEPRDLNEYQTDHDLLIRVDQRLSDLVKKMDESYEKYVTQAEFWPVKMLVYGCVAIMLSSLICALIYLVIH
jgi:hypothetical protein